MYKRITDKQKAIMQEFRKVLSDMLDHTLQDETFNQYLANKNIFARCIFEIIHSYTLGDVPE